jgi:hypothetical protein
MVQEGTGDEERDEAARLDATMSDSSSEDSSAVSTALTAETSAYPPVSVSAQRSQII